jgi:ribonuclease HI
MIGRAKTCSVLAAELEAIAIALEYADRHLHQTLIVLFSDSQQTFRVIQHGEVLGSKRMLLYRISEATARLIRKNTSVRFRWVLAHERIVGNEEADEAARAASSQKGRPTAPALERVREVEGVIHLINRDGDPVRLVRACRLIHVEDGSSPARDTHSPAIRVANIRLISDPDPG